MTVTKPVYYAKIYSTVTGHVQQELPLHEDPIWQQQINQDGTWGVVTPIVNKEIAGGLKVIDLDQVCEEGRFSVAICYGYGSPNDPIVQGGPIWTYETYEGGTDDSGATEDVPTVRLGGAGFGSLLKARLQVPGVWTPAAGFGDTQSVSTYTSSYQGIAALMLTDTVTRGALPLDIPTPISGTTTETYYGYDMLTVGQNLLDLTQLNGGPDLLFQPYFSDSATVRTQALIGNPTLTQPATPIVFDYGSSLQSVTVASDGSKLATTQYEKGNGVEAAIMWAYAQDPTLLSAAPPWPLLESIDTSQANINSQATLNSWATSNLKLYGRPVKTWTGIARADTNPILGTYLPGYSLIYNMVNHSWIPDGRYSQRLLGLQNGQNPGEVIHILQGTSGVG